MKRYFILCMTIIMSLILTTSFIGYKPKAVEAKVDRTGDHYVFVGTFMSLDYYVDYYRAANLIMKEWPGVKIDILGPANYDIQATLSIIEQQIAKKVTGLLVQPWGEDWLPTCNKVVDAGIPVVFVGVDFPQSKRLAYCGTGNFKMGMVAGEWLAKKIGYKGEVAVMRSPELANVTERYKGFMSVMNRYPDIKVVADLDHKNSSSIGAELIRGVLLRHPHLKAVWGADGISGPAAAMGIREAGVKKGSVIIVGSDREDTLLAAIEDGEIAATAVQGSSLEFYYGVKILDAYVHHLGPQLSYDDAAAGVRLIPDVVNPKVTIVTKDNVKYFRRGYVKNPRG